jgi:hypothetical protein
VRQARDEWKGLRQPRMRQEIHRLVFLDETGTTTKVTRLRGAAHRWLAARRGYWRYSARSSNSSPTAISPALPLTRG